MDSTENSKISILTNLSRLFLFLFSFLVGWSLGQLTTRRTLFIYLFRKDLKKSYINLMESFEINQSINQTDWNRRNGPEIEEMVQFLDPEISKILWFLDPEIVKMDQNISGSRYCRNGEISGSRNRRNTAVSGSRICKNGPIDFWIQKS